MRWSLLLVVPSLAGLAAASCAVSSDERSADEQVGAARSEAVAVACAADPRPAPEMSCISECEKCSSDCTAGRYCMNRLWPMGIIPYRIVMDPVPEVTASDCDREVPEPFNRDFASAIRARAAEWTADTNSVVQFVECPTASCNGFLRFVSFVPSCMSQAYTTGQTATGNQYVALEKDEPEHIAHEMGHVVGFPHTFEREDRDHYVEFSNTAFCINGADEDKNERLWKCILPSVSPNPAYPPLAPGSFGPYDEESVMNYINGGICENNEVEPDAAGPVTARDGASAIEMYRTVDGWSPFVSLGKNSNPYTPLDYQLAPGVNVIGSPAVATWGLPELHAFARGSNSHLYWARKLVVGATFFGWSLWQDIGSGIQSDAAAVSRASGELAVAVRKDGAIRLLEYAAGTWGAWQSVGSPSTGIASAPAIASWGPGSMSVFVRDGNDELMSRTRTSAGWGAWTKRGTGTFQGKPTAVSWGPGRIDVFVRGLDNALWWIPFSNGWGNYASLGGSFVGSPAVAAPTPGRLDVFVRGNDQRLWSKQLTGSTWTGFFPLGGHLNGDPAAVGHDNLEPTVEILAPILDHGAHGVWWKWSSYDRPCYHGDCAVCTE